MQSGTGARSSNDAGDPPEDIDPRYKNIDPKMIETIENEVIDNGAEIKFDDIAGLEHAKKCLREMILMPMARPDLFQVRLSLVL